MKRVLLAILLLAGCSKPSSTTKVIVGAQLPQKQIAYSVVVVDGDKIRAVGAQSDIPVPKGTEITSGLGMTLEPAQGSALEPGQPANLQLRDAKTGSIVRVMANGNWQ